MFKENEKKEQKKQTNKNFDFIKNKINFISCLLNVLKICYQNRISIRIVNWPI